MFDPAKIQVTTKRRISKYAEGVDPKTGQPFEVSEAEETITGEAAITYLTQMGMTMEEVERLATDKRG